MKKILNKSKEQAKHFSYINNHNGSIHVKDVDEISICAKGEEICEMLNNKFKSSEEGSFAKDKWIQESPHKSGNWRNENLDKWKATGPDWMASFVVRGSAEIK